MSEKDEHKDGYRALWDKLDAIEKRLFKDNGTLCIQTRVDRHEQVLKILLWATSVVGGALLTSVVAGGIFVVRLAIVRAGMP